MDIGINIRKCFLCPFFLFLGVTCFLPLVSSAEIVTSTSFKINTPVLKAGSGFSTSSSFQLWSAIGEEAVGLATTTNFNIKAGFLYVPASISVSTATEEGEPAPTTVTVITGGGGGFVIIPSVRSIVGLQRVDINNDGLINIVDLSIMLYHYGKSGGGIASYDFNKDGVIDILDISILLYYWAGQ